MLGTLDTETSRVERAELALPPRQGCPPLHGFYLSASGLGLVILSPSSPLFKATPCWKTEDLRCQRPPSLQKSSPLDKRELLFSLDLQAPGSVPPGRWN